MTSAPHPPAPGRHRRRSRLAAAVHAAVRAVVQLAARPVLVDPAAEFDTNRQQLVAEFGEDGFARMRRNVTAFYLAWPR